MTTTDDELLALARRWSALPAIGVMTVQASDAIRLARDHVALTERHRAEVAQMRRDRDLAYEKLSIKGAEVEWLKLENNKAAGIAAHSATKRAESELRAEAAESALAALKKHTRPPYEVGDDISAQLAVELSETQVALAAERKRCERLEAVVREAAFDDGTRDTVTEHNAFPFFSKLNQRMCMLRDKARAALAGE